MCDLPFTALYFAVNCFFWGGGLTLDNTCSKDAIHLCLLFLRIFFFFYIFLQENLLNKIVLKQNKSNLEIRLCLPDDVMATVMTSVTGSHYKCSSNYQPRYVLTFYSPAPCSNTVKFLTQN